jgi:hypothetical protein
MKVKIKRAADFSQLLQILDQKPEKYYHRSRLYFASIHSNKAQDYYSLLITALIDEKHKKLVSLDSLLKSILSEVNLTEDFRNIFNEFISKIKLSYECVNEYSKLKRLHSDQGDFLSLVKAEFLKSVLFPLELKYYNDMNFKKKYFNGLLEVFNLKYEENTHWGNFIPGEIKYNTTIHEKHSYVKSDFPHDTIVEVVYPGIKNKIDNEIIRKAWVILSFGY